MPGAAACASSSPSGSPSLLVALAWAATLSPFLDVDHIEVNGLRRVTAAPRSSAASGIHQGDAMVWLDPGQAVAGIEALPWVRAATVDARLAAHRADHGHRAHARGVDRQPGGDGRRRRHRPRAGDGRRRADRAPAARRARSSCPGRVRRSRPRAGPALPRRLTGLVALGHPHDHGRPTAAWSSSWCDGPEIRLGEPTQVGSRCAPRSAVLDALGGVPVAYIDVTVPTNPRRRRDRRESRRRGELTARMLRE